MQLTPKVFDTLLILVEERDRPVPHEELIRRVWPDTAAGKNNLDQNLSLLRKALGDSASEQRYVRTVRKLGYQFAAPVTEVPTAVLGRATDNGDQPAWVMSGMGSDGAARGEGRPQAGRTKILNARTFLLVAVAAAVLGGSLYGLGRVISGLKRQPPTMKITRIAGAEKSREAAVSPDGKYLAYVTAEANSQRIELRQIATNSSVVLVSADGADYFGPVFSRDGDYVYFVRRGKGDAVSTLHRVPALGGEAKRVVAGVDSAITFSPDGGRVAFVRVIRHEQTSLKAALRETAIVAADVETGEERIVRTRSSPEFFSDAGPSWSPDGETIACAAGAGTSERGARMTLVGVNTSDGSERQLSTRDWAVTRHAAWLPDGKGLVATAEESAGWAQLWHVAHPSGDARRITNDLDNYRDVSLTSAGDAVVTTRTEARFNLWVAPGGDFARIKQITFGGDHVYRRVAWSPDGRVVFPSNAAGYREIWITGADGGGHRQLTFDKGSNLLPSVSPDGRYVVFVSDRGGAGRHNVWRMDIGGGGHKQLTHGEQDFGPRVSPDARWVIYTSASAGRETLWRVPLDGGDAVQLVDAHVAGPEASPDGKLIASWYKPASDSPARSPSSRGRAAHPSKFSAPRPRSYTPSGGAPTGAA